MNDKVKMLSKSFLVDDDGHAKTWAQEPMDAVRERLLYLEYRMERIEYSLVSITRRLGLDENG